MKKFFTTFLLMGVALTGWATITAEYAEGTKTLTLNYVDDGTSTNLDQIIEPKMEHAEKIVLTGDWANKDLAAGEKIDKIFEKCVKGPKKVYLDLSGCENMRSSVKYTGEGETNWTSNNFIYLPDSNYPETVTETYTVKENVYYTYWGSNVVPEGTEVYEKNGQLYAMLHFDWGDQEVQVTKHTSYVDAQTGETVNVPEDVVLTDNGDGTFTYTNTYTLDATKFDLSKVKDKVKGLAFPNNANFTAIPEAICLDMAALENVTFGDNLVWVGNSAFKNCSKLNNVTFPQTVKVIGLDAFCGCQKFTVVDLRIRDLVKVDAAAFNMVDVDKNSLTTVYLPEPGADGKNTTLKFFANQVFASSHITELDFSYFYGIDHFAYDGEEHFGETVPSGISNTSRTFTWLVDLKKITLPPNLRHVGDECFFKCQALEELYFTGKADYDKDTCPETNVLNNPLTIGSMACNSTPLNTLQLSNNVTVIGERAFSKTSLTEVRIPASVQLIGTMAFEDQTDAEGNMTLKTVIFEEIDENCAPCQHAQTLIKEEAFLENTAISDVYVNTVVDIDCENHAFPFEVTFAQGDAQAASTGQAATLHFPEGHEAHYVNLNHTLDNETAADPGKFQKWLVEHLAAAKDQSTGYGWYEFINSGSRSTDPDNPDPVYDDNELFLRTFSDANYARIVPDGVRAYIVNHVEKNGTRYELTLQRLSVIPKETGVILFGQPNSTDSEGNAVLTMSAVQFKPGDGQPLRRDYWDVLSTTDQHFKNYLMPIIGKANIRTVEEGGNQTFEETNLLTVYPYEPYKVKGAPVEWRNFALNRLSATENLQGKFEFDASVENYAGFFRILPGTYNEGYAYLHLSADEYDSATGAECVVIEDENYYVEYSTSGDPYDPRSKTGFNWWRNDNKWENMINGWGKRNNDKFDKPGAIQFLGELEDTDGIVKLVIPENKMGEVFSITGMKVTNPNKGIYIQNGKKIIIK